jgi:hypothetical protein
VTDLRVVLACHRNRLCLLGITTVTSHSHAENAYPTTGNSNAAVNLFFAVSQSSGSRHAGLFAMSFQVGSRQTYRCGK